MLSEIVEDLGEEILWTVTAGHENDGQCLAIMGKFSLCESLR